MTAAAPPGAAPWPPSILDRIGNTPLVPLTRISAGLPAPIFGKCEHLNPGGSVKDRIALAIVRDGEARGALSPGDTLIEATAGNTGVGLALVAAVRGYRLVCVMPEKMSIDKRTALRQLGAEVIITRNAPPDDPDNFQNVARALAAERGYFLTDQFSNPANPRIHEQTTGPELLSQCPLLGAFVAGAGTGGTLTGVARYLRSRGHHARIVLADPIGSRLTGWIKERALGDDGPYAVEGIGGSAVPDNFDAALIDDAIQISDDETFATTHRLIKEEGLLVGGSAGTAVAAALRLAASGAVTGPIVALLADNLDRYRSQPWLARPEPR